MHHDSSETPADDQPMDMSVDSTGTAVASSSRTAEVAPGHAGVRLDMTAARAAGQSVQQRTRSPTPPRSLFRSTTGKGVAFTQEDINFLMRFLAYRKYVFVFLYVSFPVVHIFLSQISGFVGSGRFLEGCSHQGAPSLSSILDEILEAT